MTSVLCARPMGSLDIDASLPQTANGRFTARCFGTSPTSVARLEPVVADPDLGVSCRPTAVTYDRQLCDVCAGAKCPTTYPTDL
jgi:hypothetical protein